MTSSIQTVPFVDLGPVNREIRSEVAASWDRIIADSNFVLGEEVGVLEADLASYYGVRESVTVGNGTDSLEITLRALGIGPGDEVIVPALTFAASGIAVLRSGARPRFVDVDAETLLIDPLAVEAVIGPSTAAILAVNLYGQLAPLAALEGLAARYGLVLVEDGAQSHGARQDHRRKGEGSHAVCTSFYPTKNLGAWGDGGAVLTDDAELAAKARLIRNYGSMAKYDHSGFGFNSRLDTLQAAVLRAKLSRLDAWNQRRTAAAQFYSGLLAECRAVRVLHTAPGNEHVWHLYPVRVTERDRLVEGMTQRAIGVGIHYPEPLHLLPMFADDGRPRGSLPVSEAASATLLSLPLFAGITPGQQRLVVSALHDLIGGEHP